MIHDYFIDGVVFSLFHICFYLMIIGVLAGDLIESYFLTVLRVAGNISDPFRAFLSEQALCLFIRERFQTG